MEIPVDKICLYCENYVFKAREDGDETYGWAFCLHHGKWFTDQRDSKPVGQRACPNWK